MNLILITILFCLLQGLDDIIETEKCAFRKENKKGVISMKLKAQEISSVFSAMSKLSFAKKNTKDIEELNSVSLTARNGCMQVVFTNNLISAAYKIEGVDGDFQYVADNNTVTSCISACVDANGEFEFLMKQGVLYATGYAFVPIKTAPAKSKKFTCIKKDCGISIVASDLVNAIASTSIAVGQDSDVLQSVSLDFDTAEMQFKMTAFSGKMMAQANIPVEDMDEDNIIPHILINGKVLMAVAPLLSLAKSKIIDIAFGDGAVMFSCDNIKVVVPCNTGEFVQCEKLLDKNYSQYVTFDTKELKNQVKKMYKAVKTNIAFSSEGNNPLFSNEGFQMPANIVSTNGVTFELPINLLKTVVENVKWDNIQVSVADGMLVKVSEEDADIITYVTSVSKK